MYNINVRASITACVFRHAHLPREYRRYFIMTVRVFLGRVRNIAVIYCYAFWELIAYATVEPRSSRIIPVVAAVIM